MSEVHISVEDQFADADEDRLVKRIAEVQVEDANEAPEFDEYDEDEYDEDEYISDFDDDDDSRMIARPAMQVRGPNCQSKNVQQTVNKSSNVKSFQPNEKTMAKYIDRINIDKYAPLASKIGNAMDAESRGKNRDKSDRATVEQVMDPRTRMIIFKMIQRGIIDELNGCISTGKEANVYHSAHNETGIDRAVKVYKTSILTFKDRDKYVSGEFRFRHGYCRHNPRKMVKTWAEKEFRNLTRIYQAGIKCPQPIHLRSHVLVMQFMGEKGFPAPLLKDANIDESTARKLYLDSVKLVHSIYNKARLVHADLSEFNILYFNNEIYVIDVSQSVEHDHPHSLEFLRKDCENINDFFKKKNVAVMTVQELFNFVTDPTVTDVNLDDYLDRAMEIASNRILSDVDKINEEVFKHSYIPYNMDQVLNFERDSRRAKDGESLIYTTLIGIKPDLSKPRLVPDLLENVEGEKINHEEIANEEPGEEDSEDVTDSGDEDDDESDEEEDGEFDENNNDKSNDEKNIKYFRPRDESPNSKKVRKNAIKEEKREKRANKTPKHVKRRAIKIAKIRKGGK